MPHGHTYQLRLIAGKCGRSVISRLGAGLWRAAPGLDPRATVTGRFLPDIMYPHSISTVSSAIHASVSGFMNGDALADRGAEDDVATIRGCDLLWRANEDVGRDVVVKGAANGDRLPDGGVALSV